MNINTDELQSELAEQSRRLTSLIQRTNQQAEDIRTLQEEVADLKETIPSENDGE